VVLVILLLAFLFIVLAIFAYKPSQISTAPIIYNAAKKESINGKIQRILNKPGSSIIVFDVETNGLKAESCSILSCSAIRYTYDDAFKFKEEARFNRYYFPHENFHKTATDINGLTRLKVKELRGDCDYAKFFNEDEDFGIFCQDSHLLVAHNISFDASFIPFIRRGKSEFCTMKNNTDIVRSKWMPDKNEWKWPTLKETATFYNITASSKNLHNSMYDTEITALIFIEMVKRASKIVTNDIPYQILKLAELKDVGIFTVEEFENMKRELLAKM